MGTKQDMMDWLSDRAACEEGLEWARQNASSLSYAWAHAPEGEWVIWLATRPGVLDDRSLQLFVKFCAQQVGHLLTDSHPDVTPSGQETHYDAHEVAAYVDFATSAFGGGGLELAPAPAAYEIAAHAACALASNDSTYAVARNAQAKWLRENVEPNLA